MAVHLATEALASVAVIIPVLNDAAALRECLAALQPLRREGLEIVVVDGGSRDDSAEIAAGLADKVVVSGPGRGLQMNAGALVTRREWLLFVHADTQLPKNLADIVMAWRYSRMRWGFFALRLSGRGIALRIVEWFINQRSYITGIGTGDQCIFVRRDIFERVEGYQNIPLMEDVALSKVLRKISRPLWVTHPVITSSRRWQVRGALPTIWLMWRLRLAYFFGADPHRLAEKYYGPR